MLSLRLFLEGSSFNSDLAQSKCRIHADNVLALWEELASKKRLPKSELVPTGKTLASLL